MAPPQNLHNKEVGCKILSAKELEAFLGNSAQQAVHFDVKSSKVKSYALGTRSGPVEGRTFPGMIVARKEGIFCKDDDRRFWRGCIRIPPA